MSPSETWTEKARSIPIEDELARRGVRLKGQKERAGPCPHCGGTDRFSINTAKQVYNCRGCGRGGDVIDLVQHLDGVDFVAACTMLAGERPKVNGAGNVTDLHIPREAAKWIYKDEDGAVAFAVKRIEYQNPDGTYVLKDGKRKKTFRQARPDPNNPGRWIHNIDGVRPLLYELPELLKAKDEGKIILIVEGEAKADLLWSWGIPGTCCAMGSGKWRPELSDFLNGADVVILPDNDDPGRKHADAVAASLQDIASGVRVLELPDLAPKGDIVDWAKGGGTRQRLDALIATHAKPWTAQAGADSEVEIWDFGAAPYTPSPRGWLLGTVFCREFVSSILAPGGAGKTALRDAQFLALTNRQGKKVTGEHVFQRCRVLKISLEDSKDELTRRMLAAMKYHGITHADVAGYLFTWTPRASIGKLLEMDPVTRQVKIGEMAKQIEAEIVRRKIDLVSLDPFVKSHGVEENANAIIDKVVETLSNLACKYKIGVDTPHHVSKGQLEPGNADKGRGASAMVDAARLVKTLTPMSSEEAKRFGIKEEDRKQFIRVDNGKVNITRGGGAPHWFELVGVPLDNGNDLYPKGDEVQTVRPWTPPEIWADLPDATLLKILDKIEEGPSEGERYTHASGAKKRAAWRVIVETVPQKPEAQAREIIAAWVRSGLLEARDYHSATERKDVGGLWVNAVKRPGTVQE
jgi:AAA domain/CHC2 zinc finger